MRGAAGPDSGRVAGSGDGEEERVVHSRGRRRARGGLVGQWRQPPEFRVPPPFLDPDQAARVADALAEAEAAEARAVAARTADDPAADDRTANSPAALLGAATGIWRALRKLDQRGDRLSAADARQIRRYIRASRQALVDDGLQIQEHDGAPFDPGQSLEVLAFEDDPGLTGETVLETVRPSVYFRGDRIQMGQVVVGRPMPEQPPGS